MHVLTSFPLLLTLNCELVVHVLGGDTKGIEYASCDCAGMDNDGIAALCRMLIRVSPTSRLRVLRLGPPTDNGGKLSEHAMEGGITSLLRTPHYIRVHHQAIHP